MVLAEIPDNVIFIIVMLAIAAFKALGEKFGKNKEETYEKYDEEDSVESDYEEYTRQLRERQAHILAQQQSRPQAPPPLPAGQGPPTKLNPPVTKTVEVTPYSLPVVKKPQLSAAERKALEDLQKASSPSDRRVSTGTTARTRARRVLASPYAARDAIVLSEILGPPKGQRL